MRGRRERRDGERERGREGRKEEDISIALSVDYFQFQSVVSPT